MTNLALLLQAQLVNKKIRLYKVEHENKKRIGAMYCPTPIWKSSIPCIARIVSIKFNDKMKFIEMILDEDDNISRDAVPMTIHFSDPIDFVD